MDRQSALQALGLSTDASQQDIVAALTEKKQNLADKKASAPTAALKAKFVTLEKELADIEQALLAQPVSEAPVEPVSTPPPRSNASSSLSQTKLADLPQSQQSYSGFDGGETGAQIHLQSGQILANRYEIKEQIGAGGMGAVYHAFDRTKQEDIALKMLLPALLQNERARQRFLDEARISARLSHPNIVNVHDVQQDGDFFFLTMELLHGQDLRQLMEARQISRQPFDEAEAQTLAQTLAAALAYAHQHTVHRDIKPENIWVTEDGDYKIMDFGIARVQSTSQRSKSGAVLGTAYYMAPEQLKGTSTTDGRADQYALGVLLYELLSGDVPAGRFKPLRELRKDIGKGFASAVEKALETRAEDRYADMVSFAAALQHRGSGPGISFPELPWKMLGGVVAVLLLVLGLGMTVVSGNIHLSNLLPMSAEQKAQREAQLARLQGEIRVLKQRLDASRRNLASDVRDAERNKSPSHSTLQQWQTLTENSIFNGSIIGDLEGTLSMAETLQRNGQYDPAEAAFTEVKSGYEKLNVDFIAGERLYAADRTAQAARSDWQAYARKYEFTDTSPSAEQAQQHYDEGTRLSRSGELATALSRFGQSAQDWQAAQEDDVVVAQVRATEAAWGEAERKRHAALAAEVERKRKAAAAAAEAERQRIARIVASATESLAASIKDIPAGGFQMGLDARYGNPGRRVTIKAFRMMEHEVTFAQWDACVAAGGCSHKPDDQGWGRGNRPVINVSWNDITQQFIPWLNKATGQTFRLPSEAEWEYAARAGSTTEYSWGDDIGRNRANCDGCGSQWDNSKTAPVKSFAANAFELYDMQGNVWEWTQEDYSVRVLRGGSWSSAPNALRSANRLRDAASYRSNIIGFRLVQDR